MAKLTAAARRKLPDSAFAYPKQRLYPIHDAGHRKAALREAGRSDTRGTRRHVQKRINQRLGKTSRRRSPARRR